MTRAILLAMCGALVTLTLVGAMLTVGTRTEAAEPPLFKVGETYTVVWDCAPALQMFTASAPQPSAIAPADCYIERLKIQKIRKDGWIDAIDLRDNSIWGFNMNRAIARRIYVPPAAA